tara:strand:+ start:854 stop:1834 length:981 start_codon:yes stop_codon:yes gene_type:complete
MGNGILLQKALETSDLAFGSSRMNRSQADRFIRMTANQSVLLAGNVARVVPVDNPKSRIPKVSFTTPVTEKATENTDSGNVVEPTYSFIDYDTEKLRTAIDVTTEVLEENIEGEGHRNTIMSELAVAVGHDYEHLAILGDATTYSADTTQPGRLLKTFDGWYVLGQSGVNVDFAGATISRTVFSEMIRNMPNVYKQRRGDLRFFCSPSIVQDYRDQLASRQTDTGDAALQGAGDLVAYGIPIIEVPLIPENLDRFGTSEGWTDSTFIWLTFPENLVMVVSRELELYWEFKPRIDAWEATVYSKIGCQIENLAAFCFGHSLRVAGAS